MNDRLRTLFFLPALLLLLAFLIGCGSDSSDRGRVMAEVGGEKIYEDEVDALMAQENRNFNSFDDELKYRKAVVDSLIVQRLLIQAAYEHKIDELEEVQRLVLGNKDKFLLDILYVREIEEKADVTDEEIEDWYDKMEYQYKVSHILFNNKDTAEKILDSIQNGGNFEELAVEYSIDPSAKQNRGELNYFVWGQMIMDFQEKVINMNPGEISTPFKTKYGWHIVKMVDKAPNPERRSLDAVRDDIRTAIKNVKKGELIEAFNKALKDRVNVKVDTGTVEYLMHKREALYPPQILENLPKNDYDIDQLDRNDKELILASWEGGQITVGEYLSNLQQFRNRVPLPSLTAYDSLAEFIYQVNVMDLLAAEARRRGFENDPDFKEKLERFKELTMADVMRNDSLKIPDPPDEGEIRQYYEDNLDEFREPPKIEAYEIMVPNKEDALKYKRQIRSLNKFKEVAAEVTERIGRREKAGHLGYMTERAWGRIYRAADETPLGGISEPVEMANGMWSIVYVTDKRAESIRDYNSVRKEISTKLEKELRREIFQEWVEQRKEEVNIEIYENNIRASVETEKEDQTDEAKG